MVVDRADEATSLPSLVLETVSGARPCELCLSIQEQAQDDQPDPTLILSSSRPAPSSPRTSENIILSPPRPSTHFPTDTIRADTLPAPPLDQPPQSIG